ncbi:hypothetical protein TWF106_009901 [Orbilia oligospora]|uniref:Myb-like DNA-binding domain-containing protein n=1 Tax=Orbilia oligospora TaxID=2813651 RepID=A0A6G1LXG3_ORBOL|nr:hypothetical protein TWF679_002869 [Orbilia oligospora]KAF3222204.1 hypothetical protein TWF191_006963 [Orbilia oligospora]KAF3227388.1 hypothetical protein TWF106_009901 [Orbilia oligospora]KAF3237699.1 hypothetical protein TWF192_010808 [Orbilia oligospora]
MSSSGSSPKQTLSDLEFLLCCIDSVSNGGINYGAVAKAANYANDGRARARLSRINSKHGTRLVISKREEEKMVEKQVKANTPKDPSNDTKMDAFAENKLADGTVPAPDKAGRVTRSSASKVPASSDVKAKKKKPTSSA